MISQWDEPWNIFFISIKVGKWINSAAIELKVEKSTCATILRQNVSENAVLCRSFIVNRNVRHRRPLDISILTFHHKTAFISLC